MYSNNSNGRRAAWARGFMALFAMMLAMGLALAAFPAEAQPFAYVTNGFSNSVSVIDTATNTVVTGPGFPIPVGAGPFGVAVTPDGKHVYVTNFDDNTVSVIDTTTNPNTVVATVAVGPSPPEGVAVTPDGKHVYVVNGGFGSASNTVSVIDTTTNPNTVVATVTVGSAPIGVAVAPDGKHVYVTTANILSGTVSVIDTTTNPPSVVATVTVGSRPTGVAVTPDGKHVYVADIGSNSVSVIDTTTNPNTVVGAPIPVGTNPEGVAVTPDGKHVYVTNFADNTVSVIETTGNTVMTTVAVGDFPIAVAVTPDGKHAYVANNSPNRDPITGTARPGTVSVIDTTTNPNTVVATVTVGVFPVGVGIVSPPPGVPFLAFSAKLAIHFGGAPNKDSFDLQSSFTLSSTASNGINPITEPVTLQVGTFATTIPPGSFKKNSQGFFTLAGVINGVSLQALIKPTGTLRYSFNAAATGANLTGTTNPVTVMLTIGDDSGMTSVTAEISH